MPRHLFPLKEIFALLFWQQHVSGFCSCRIIGKTLFGRLSSISLAFKKSQSQSRGGGVDSGVMSPQTRGSPVGAPEWAGSEHLGIPQAGGCLLPIGQISKLIRLPEQKCFCESLVNSFGESTATKLSVASLLCKCSQVHHASRPQ